MGYVSLFGLVILPTTLKRPRRLIIMRFALVDKLLDYGRKKAARSVLNKPEMGLGSSGKYRGPVKNEEEMSIVR